MPVFSASQLEPLASGIFRGAGAPADIADRVAHSLVVSNLMGHDSHGVLRIPSYLEAIEKGTCVPSARPTTQEETATTARIDGNWAFGQITAHYATEVAIDKAVGAGVAAVTFLRCNHIGRLGEYTEQAARGGMVAFMVGGTFNGGAVTPYGGAGRVMGTNPIAFGVPAGEEGPVVTDMATSVVAEGKLRVARAKHVPLAPGVIVDKDGNPSIDAEDYYAGGMLLPFGGHKGYGLSVVVDLLGRHLTGGDKLAGDEAVSFGNFMFVVKVDAFRPLAEFQQVVSGRLEQIKSVKKAPGFDEVLVPGEPERRTMAQRERDGITLPEDTVKDLSSLADRYGVAMPVAR